MLFHESRIRKRCAIITDRDAAIVDTTVTPGDSRALTDFKAKCQASDLKGAARKVQLNAFVAGNQWLSAKYAAHTFEVDFIEAGNVATVVDLVTEVYVDAQTIATARVELSSGDKAQYGRRVLTMAANQGKGWFAIMLGKKLDHQTILPDYINEAIFFARPELSKELFSNIFSYRLNKAQGAGALTRAALEAAQIELRNYLAGTKSLADLKTFMTAALPGDQVHRHLANVH